MGKGKEEFNGKVKWKLRKGKIGVERISKICECCKSKSTVKEIRKKENQIMKRDYIQIYYLRCTFVSDVLSAPKSVNFHYAAIIYRHNY